MTKKQQFTFEDIFEQNKRRIHYHIHKLNIRDPHEDFFQEGLIALWRAYETHEPDKGPMATYFNFSIRNRLIDKIRQDGRRLNNDEQVIMQKKTDFDDGNHFRSSETTYPIVHTEEMPIQDDEMWKQLKAQLTDNQWKWVDYFIIKDLSVKDIAHLENKSEDAVKSWGRQVRKKLRNKPLLNQLGFDIQDDNQL